MHYAIVQALTKRSLPDEGYSLLNGQIPLIKNGICYMIAAQGLLPCQALISTSSETDIRVSVVNSTYYSTLHGTYYNSLFS